MLTLVPVTRLRARIVASRLLPRLQVFLDSDFAANLGSGSILKRIVNGSEGGAPLYKSGSNIREHGPWFGPVGVALPQAELPRRSLCLA